MFVPLKFEWGNHELQASGVRWRVHAVGNARHAHPDDLVARRELRDRALRYDVQPCARACDEQSGTRVCRKSRSAGVQRAPLDAAVSVRHLRDARAECYADRCGGQRPSNRCAARSFPGLVSVVWRGHSACRSLSTAVARIESGVRAARCRGAVRLRLGDLR